MSTAVTANPEKPGDVPAEDIPTEEIPAEELPAEETPAVPGSETNNGLFFYYLNIMSA